MFQADRVYRSVRAVGLAVALVTGSTAFLSKAAANTVSMSDLKGCGGTLVAFQPCADGAQCKAVSVFRVPDGWHGLERCMRSIRDAWNRQGPTAQVALPDYPTIAQFSRAQILSQIMDSHVRFARADDKGSGTLDAREIFDFTNLSQQIPFDRVIFRNERGFAYHGMGQSGVAYFLYQFAALAKRGGYEGSEQDQTFYRSLARGAIKEVLADVNDGGLASSAICDGQPGQQCTWYHSITRKDLPTASAGTLNQMLHVIRDLGGIADFTAKSGFDEKTDFEAGVRAGLNQLFLAGGHTASGVSPNLADFVGPANGPTQLHWAYYGFNAQKPPPKGGYYLKEGFRNCNYHIHDLGLLTSILKRAEKHPDLSDVASKALSCESPILVFDRTLRQAVSSQPSATQKEGSDQFSCHNPEVYAETTGKFFAAAFASCPR